MSFFDYMLLGVGLSMDAFAVAAADGLTMKKKRSAFLTAAMFGLFQAAMPLLGYFLGSGFAQLISEYDHFVALAALGFIGGKMVIEGISDIRSGKTEITAALNFPTLLVQAAATSIDALIVGISLAGTGAAIYTASAVIGAEAFLISLIGALGGRRLGQLAGAKATLAGGIVLIAIGIKTAAEHLLFG